ncbi:protein MRG1-like isoform X5 [Phoenix dactylifera]|uniref:Protein MRG1-like isoform X5 n=1 Tax=Phoenix dactylifera TaxID=42345 RepID=A0A8B8IYL7_PHODC|nr:protein MRG1-like isoform X5 [Phoenix dactylifera]
MGSSNTGGGDGDGDGDEDESPMEGGGEAKADPSASDSPAAGLFSEGEKVLAYHGPRIYEAKVQKAEPRKDEWRYFVHYLGWSKNWDEWVGTNRLMKFTLENVRKQQELAKNQSADKIPKSGRSTQNKPKGSNAAKGKKRKPQFGNELVKLPRSPNVDDILKKYLDYRMKKDGMIAESVGEILKGLRCYFDKALPATLLYKKERQQYQEAIHDNISPSTIYGAEHLLRLFVKLPELLAYVNMEDESLAKLQQKLVDFLKFLQKNQSSFFLSAYDASKGVVDDTDTK